MGHIRGSKQNCNLITGLLDNNKQYLVTGDIVEVATDMPEYNYRGPIFYHCDYDCFGIFMGCWYADKDPCDPACYGKFVPIPSDNGMRMQITKIGSYEDLVKIRPGEYYNTELNLC